MAQFQIDGIFNNIIDFYLENISNIMYASINKSFTDIYYYHGNEENYKKNLYRIHSELSDDQAKIEEEKIINSNKNYNNLVKSLFKSYIVMLTLGCNNKLLNKKTYEMPNISLFTKRCIQLFAISEKSEQSMKLIIKKVIFECLPMKYITEFFISVPISKEECYIKSRANIKKIISENK